MTNSPMTALNKQALLSTDKHANQHMLSRLIVEANSAEIRDIAEAVEQYTDRLIAALEAAEKRIDELSASHSKLRDTIAAIHNTIRMGGGYTPLAAILNAAKRAHEESASAAGIGVKGN
ncbi:hypothetical protein PI452_001533 [Citrobacter freundii]